MFIVKVREDHLLRHTLFENAATTSNTLCVVLQKKPSLKKKMGNNKRMRRKGAMQGSRRRKRSLSFRNPSLIPLLRSCLPKGPTLVIILFSVPI